MAIKVNYDGLASDVSTLTANVKSICDSLDTLNSVENIIPGSWTSPASEKYRSTVESDLVARVADLEGSLTGLIKMLVSISDSFSNLEDVIGNDLKSWYEGLDSNGKVLDILNNGLPNVLTASMLYNNFISNFEDNSTDDLDLVNESNDLPVSGGLSGGSGTTGKKATSIGDFIPENKNDLYIMDENNNFIKLSKDNDYTLPYYPNEEHDFNISTLPYYPNGEHNTNITLPFNMYTIDDNGNYVRIKTEIDPNTSKIITDENGNYIKMSEAKIDTL